MAISHDQALNQPDEPVHDWLPPVYEEMERLRGQNQQLLTRIGELELLTARQDARIDELALERTRQRDRANRLSDELSAALNQLDRIVEHARAEPRPRTVRVRAAHRLVPEALPTGSSALDPYTPAPTWANVVLVSVTVAATVAILFGVAR